MDEVKVSLPKEASYSKWLRWCRKRIDSCLEYLIAMAKAVKFYKADAVLVEGKEIHSGQLVNVFYFGNYRNYKFMFNTIFSEFRIKEMEKDVLSFNAMRWVQRYEVKSDLVMLDLGYVYSKLFQWYKPEYICIPDCIGQKRDIGSSRQELLNSLKRHGNKANHINRIIKHNVTYRIVATEKHFRDFYYNYYLPYARKRFGDTAIIEKEWRFLRQCRNGKVMQILHKDEGIAYRVMQLEPGRLRNLLVGVSENVDDELYSIVFNALYYYSFIYGFENGCYEVDLCNTRALLNDGVYTYKRGWGAYVYACKERDGTMFIKPTNFSLPVVNIFSHNYFVTSKNDKLIAKILCGDEEMSVDFIEKLIKNHYSKGIDAVRIYSLRKVSPQVSAWFSGNGPCVEFVDLSSQPNPQEVFCM